MIVLKGIFGGSLKITSQNKKYLSKAKKRLKRFLGFSESLKSRFVCVCARLFAFVCFCKHPFYYTPFGGTLRTPSRQKCLCLLGLFLPDFF